MPKQYLTRGHFPRRDHFKIREFGRVTCSREAHGKVPTTLYGKRNQAGKFNLFGTYYKTGKNSKTIFLTLLLIISLLRLGISYIDC